MVVKRKSDSGASDLGQAKGEPQHASPQHASQLVDVSGVLGFGKFS